MKPLLVTSGEPAGIGPDICLALAGHHVPLVVLGSLEVLQARAVLLKLDIQFKRYALSHKVLPEAGMLVVWDVPVQTPVLPGVLAVSHAAYVLTLLRLGVEACLNRSFSALVTAPVHKGIINESGVIFSGHTEFFAEGCGVDDVVMLLVCSAMKVALVTTHLPLSAVPAAITKPRVKRVIEQVYHGLQVQFGVPHPRVWVAGLNPHAGEGGHLGREEIDIIDPVIRELKAQGLCLEGPLSADTLFTIAQTQQVDAIIAMYHDQGLPVLKYAGFGAAVNVTLGLPIIRTSVDHGTALSLAGSGQADAGSLLAAVNLAQQLGERCQS